MNESKKDPTNAHDKHRPKVLIKIPKSIYIHTHTYIFDYIHSQISVIQEMQEQLNIWNSVNEINHVNRQRVETMSELKGTSL